MPIPRINPRARAIALQAPDPRLAAWTRGAVLLGALLVLALPAARGSNAWLGWMPLWLLGMPLSACWALHRVRIARGLLGAARAGATAVHARRRWRPQAARRSMPALRVASLRRSRAA